MRRSHLPRRNPPGMDLPVVPPVAPMLAKLIRELIDQMNGLLDHAPLETRVAWVRHLFERIDVDGVEQRAIAR
jgi:hypothetical protein